MDSGKSAKSIGENLTLTGSATGLGDKRLNDWVRIMPLAAQVNPPPYRVVSYFGKQKGVTVLA